MVFTNGMAEAEWQRQQYINELNCAQQEQKSLAIAEKK